MISRTNYWLSYVIMAACVNSTFGYCCNDRHGGRWSKGRGVDKGKKEKPLYFTKIDTAKDAENVKKCCNEEWHKKKSGKVLFLQEAKESDPDVLKVTGSGNKWEITDSKGEVLKKAGCDSSENKWIIVEVTSWIEDTKKVGDRFIFYVDDITPFNGSGNDLFGVFDSIKCYSIKIIAANTENIQEMKWMFFKIHSVLEQDGKNDTGPGLIGLEKLNVENVTNMRQAFTKAIHKQATLDQLKKWRFSGTEIVDIHGLFSCGRGEVLDFSVLNDWCIAKDGKNVGFRIDTNFGQRSVFLESDRDNFNHPIWMTQIT